MWSAIIEQPRQACSGQPSTPGSKGPVDNQLAPTMEQVQQAGPAVGPNEFVLLVNRQPGHPPALCGQCVVGAKHFLFLRQELLARSPPFLRRDDRGCVHQRCSPFFLWFNDVGT
jgi:hypothetical protein